MVQRAINAKAKASLRFSTIVWNSDAYCPRGHRLSHNISSKVQTQGFNNKNSSRFEESKPKDLKPAPPRDNVAVKSAKKVDKKDKKKRFRG